MDNKNHNPDHEPDGTTSTIPLTAVPGKFGSPHRDKRLDQNQADLDFDYTTPNIPYPSEEMNSVSFVQVGNDWDLTQMKALAFDTEFGKSVVLKPQVIEDPTPISDETPPQTRPRRRWLLWTALVSFAVFLLAAVSIALFLLFPRNSAFTLKVLEAPPGSKVFVDGVQSGVPQADGTIVVQGLRADEPREVAVKHEGFDDWNTTVKGEAGKELQVTAKLAAQVKLAARAKKEIEYTGPMVLVSAGAFVMGDNKHHADEGPEHQVTLSSYYIDKFEVTNQQYKRFCDETHRSYPPSPFWNPQYFSTQPQSPVVGVTWADAAAYAKWAGKRLPTEEEWEKAASWDPDTQSKRQWPWGNTAEQKRATIALPRTAVRLSAANENATGASAYGAQDMAGNAAEWVDAFYQPYRGNSQANSEFGTSNRVVRGGTSVSTFEDVRTTRRFARLPDYTDAEKANNAYLIGFRCAVSADDAKLQEYLKGQTQ